MKTSLEQQIPFNNVYHFLGARYGRVYRNGNEFWTVDENPRLVAIFTGSELILPSTNGTGVVKIPVHKIPEYRRKYYNLYYCKACLEERGEGLYRNSFISAECPSGHPWKLLASTFTYLEVRPRQPPKPQTEKDPEVQSALNDIKETRLFCELYGAFFRRQAREKARRSALKKELQIVQVSKVSKQGTGQPQEKQPRQQVPNFNFQITYIDKEGIKHHLSPEQILELCRRLGVDVPAPPLQTVDQVVKEFRADHDFIPTSIEDEEEILFPLARGRQSKQRQKQREKFDTKRYKVTWKGAASIRMQQIPAPLSTDALTQKQEQPEQHDHQQITAEEFKSRYQLEVVTPLPNGGYKGYRYISYNKSLVKLTYYSFSFRPSGRNVGEFNPEQLTLATYLANQMSGTTIVSEDKKRGFISLCVLLEDATIVVARRRGQ